VPAAVFALCLFCLFCFFLFFSFFSFFFFFFFFRRDANTDDFSFTSFSLSRVSALFST